MTSGSSSVISRITIARSVQAGSRLAASLGVTASAELCYEVFYQRQPVTCRLEFVVLWQVVLFLRLQAVIDGLTLVVLGLLVCT